MVTIHVKIVVGHKYHPILLTVLNSVLEKRSLCSYPNQTIHHSYHTVVYSCTDRSWQYLYSMVTWCNEQYNITECTNQLCRQSLLFRIRTEKFNSWIQNFRLWNQILYWIFQNMSRKTDSDLFWPVLRWWELDIRLTHGLTTNDYDDVDDNDEGIKYVWFGTNRDNVSD